MSGDVTSTEALRLADCIISARDLMWHRDATAELRRLHAENAALSKAAMEEPVAWMVYTLDGTSVCVTDNPADFTDQHRALPLYTRHGVSDEQ